MRNTLTTIFVVCFMFMACYLKAQPIFGIKAGVNISTMTLKSGGSGLDPKAVTGFHAGATVELPLSDVFSIQPGVFISTKGSKYHLEAEGVDLIISPNFIEIPVNALLKFDMGSTRFLAFVGPYVAYAIGGTVYATDGTNEGSQDLEFGEGEEKDMKQFDNGFNFGAGIEIKQIQVSVQYNLGLANLSSVTENGTEMKNRTVSISVGYLFN